MKFIRLPILLAIVAMAIHSLTINFIPTVQYGLLSLSLAALITWLLSKLVINPLLKPFSKTVTRFKIFYFGFFYIAVFMAISFSAPALLENIIAKPFTQNVMVAGIKKSARSMPCGYKIYLDRYGSYFANSYCVKRANYREHRNIRQGQTITLSGFRSWAGDHIKKISERYGGNY